MRKLRVALAQINTTVGDLEGNTSKILEYLEKARQVKADLVAFPEMAIPGYPPEDLLFKPSFIRDNRRKLEEVAAHCQGLTAIVGFVDADGDIRNAGAIIHNARVVGVYHKMYLPNYGVFDEDRYFKAGTSCLVFVINGISIGVNICEDMWYPTGPATLQREAGAEVIVNINASPYHAGKGDFREKMLATRATDNELFVAYVNLVGGQDELVFDGGSMVFNERGDLLALGKQFEEDLLVVDIDADDVLRYRLHDSRPRKSQSPFRDGTVTASQVVVSRDVKPWDKPPIEARDGKPLEYVAEVYSALVLGTRDYVRKSGFHKVLIGLSGGIDSSIVAAIAVDALGKENVVGVTMPSRYSSEGSISDSKWLAQNLGIPCWVIPIEEPFTAYLDILQEAFKGTKPNVAEENIQARVRGNILMAISNKFGWMVLTTGNKSEMATGYATLYGDMAGGFAVIKDVMKTLVYKLSDYRNSLAGKEIVPRTVIEKVPTAELRPDQKDTDTLPPYSVLDVILQAYVEEDKSWEEIVAMGYEEALVKRVIRMVDLSEYKRRQAPPGVKITPRAFGKDRRLPIVNHYQG